MRPYPNVRTESSCQVGPNLNVYVLSCQSHRLCALGLVAYVLCKLGHPETCLCCSVKPLSMIYGDTWRAQARDVHPPNSASLQDSLQYRYRESLRGDHVGISPECLDGRRRNSSVSQSSHSPHLACVDASSSQQGQPLSHIQTPSLTQMGSTPSLNRVIHELDAS